MRMLGGVCRWRGSISFKRISVLRGNLKWLHCDVGSGAVGLVEALPVRISFMSQQATLFQLSLPRCACPRAHCFRLTCKSNHEARRRLSGR